MEQELKSMRSARRWGVHGAVLALTATLAACGGGGSGGGFDAVSVGTGGTGTTSGTSSGTNGGTNGSGGGVTSTQITGVAAVGAPLVGSVTVKDAKGVTRTAVIGTNGSYSVDVSGMTAPFVFRAEGSVNGTTAIVHSIATEADLNGRINITQLTDLIVSNIAGQLAQNYFDNFDQSGNASLASKALVDAEVAKLKEKLLPVLTALGVDAAIDLLHSAFTPLSDPLDKALDVIRVSYDTAANTATISNIVNAITVVDQLAVKAAAETSPSTLSATNVATGATDQELVKQVLKDFTAKYANGLPSSSDISPLMTTSFRWNDMNLANSLAELTTNADFVGVSFTDIEIRQIDYSDPTKITAHLSFSVKTPQGVELGRLDNWKVRKGTDGIWRLHGDQRALNLDWFNSTSVYHGLPGSATCVDTGLEFNIEDPDNTNDGGAIAYILVKGPGLPAAGLKYLPPALGGRWMINGANMEKYVVASTCAGAPPSVLTDAQIAAIPDKAQYTLTAYGAGDAQISFPTGTSDGIYKVTMERRPLTLAEAATGSVFPVIDQTTIDAFNVFDSSVGGTISFGASNLNPLTQAYVQMRRRDSTQTVVDSLEKAVLPNAAGQLSTSLSFVGDPTITSSTMWVESPDKYRRNLQNYYYR